MKKTQLLIQTKALRIGKRFKEIVYPDGTVDLDKVTLETSLLNPLEIWCSEFQKVVLY